MRTTQNLDNIFGLNLVLSVLCTLVISVKAGSPSDDDLVELSLMLAGDWKGLGRILGLGEARIVAFHEENEKLSEKAFAMLRFWKRSMGSYGTYQVLFDALCHELVARRDLAEQICLSQEGN